MSDSPSILVRRTNAPTLLEGGQRTFDRLLAAGMIGPREIRLGGGVFYSADELRRWAASSKNGVLPTRSEWLALNGGDS